MLTNYYILKDSGIKLIPNSIKRTYLLIYLSQKYINTGGKYQILKIELWHRILKNILRNISDFHPVIIKYIAIKMYFKIKQ